jgi:hypothetical protein
VKIIPGKGQFENGSIKQTSFISELKIMKDKETHKKRDLSFVNLLSNNGNNKGFVDSSNVLQKRFGNKFTTVVKEFSQDGSFSGFKKNKKLNNLSNLEYLSNDLSNINSTTNTNSKKLRDIKLDMLNYKSPTNKQDLTTLNFDKVSSKNNTSFNMFDNKKDNKYI